MKPPKNQRVSSTRQRKQQHLLDVKIRVGKERERRFRTVAGFICKTILIASLAGGAWFGGREALRIYVWENPDYFVHDPRVTTDGTLTREQVLAVAELLEDRNVFTIDLGKVRAAIEKMPQVESAEVQRTMPNHLAINISERRPIAWVTSKKEEDPTTSERSFLIDARCIVLRSRVLLPEYYHLPIISGVETENLVPGQRVNTFDIQAAIELVRLNADSTRFQVRNIDLKKGYCLVVTDQRRAKITFGFDRIDNQLSRLNQLLDVIEPTRQEIQTINLIPARNVPVTFHDPTLETPADEPPMPKPEPADAKGRGASVSGAGNSTKGAGKPAKAGSTTLKSKKETAPPTRKPAPVDRLKKRFNVNG